MPAPEGPMSFISALRADNFSITTPEYSSSTSIMTSSIGSIRSPVSGSFWKTTRGREIATSKPSRRMFSMSTPSCNSPRPATSKASFSAVSVTRIATLDSASRSRRSRITRDCTLVPSRPASGESLTLTVMEMVGGSIGCAGKASVSSMAHKVSATVAFDRPAMATMSPASAPSSTG